MGKSQLFGNSTRAKAPAASEQPFQVPKVSASPATPAQIDQLAKVGDGGGCGGFRNAFSLVMLKNVVLVCYVVGVQLHTNFPSLFKMEVSMFNL